MSSPPTSAAPVAAHGTVRSEERPRPPSITDVAALAGVSYQTVSRVANERAGVRESTRQRVLAAMSSLGYQPNSLARSLVSGKSHTIGLIGLSSSFYGPTKTLKGITDAARMSGYHVLATSAARVDYDFAVDAGEQLLRRAVDGVLVAHQPEPDALGALRALAARVPVVVVGALTDGVPSIDLDAATGAECATEHLLGLGHRTVHHVAGPLDWASARDRRDGWQRALRRAGAVVPPLLPGDWTARSGYAAGWAIAKMPSVTAVLAANDEMATGLLLALHESGRRVPADVSVVGFDDTPEAAYLIPPLTTMRQDLESVGRLAVAMLLDEIDGEAGRPRPERPVPTLVVRHSTRPPAWAKPPSVTLA